ncbi:MAG: polysaccharide lyase family 8 super-sandwich domain-containing protein [Armatimonadota bacterium]
MNLWLAALLLLLPLPVLADVTAPNDMARARAQFGALMAEQGVDPVLVARYAAELREDGSWGDLDYRSTQAATWPPAIHTSRMRQMAMVLRRGGAKGATPEVLLAAIHRAFGYWRAQDYQCPNWWHNQIGVPQELLTTALLLGDDLQPEELAYLTQTILPRVKIGMTGQNRVWLAGNTLMGGLLQNDVARVDAAAEAIFAEVVVTGKEGIQPDYSFHQHGAQQQFGNYGLSFANDTVKWAEVLRDTRWAMPADKRQILSHYLLDGSAWTLWRGRMDISACGRQLWINAPVSKGSAIVRVLKAMPRVDPDNAGDYAAGVRRNTATAANDLVGNRFFWRSDYLIHRRPEFCFTLKLSSKRVTGVESLNNENLSGFYLADGATFLYRSGQEYTDIFPVWNWRQLPGVTCAQEAGPMPSFSTNRLWIDWVGGVSDGRHGGMAVDYVRDLPGAKRITAKKAWFCFDDQVVCLGASITVNLAQADPVLTTVNQCLLQGPVRISDGEVRALETGTLRSGTVSWIEHDGVRYHFPTPQAVVLSAGPRTGNWSAVRQTGDVPREDMTRNIFHLAIEHGIHPKDGGYAYIIQPADPDRQPVVELLQNTPQLQAARVGAQVQAAFYSAGTLVYAPDHTLSVDAPCLLLLDTAAHRVYVSDPLHTRRSLTLTIDGTPYTAELPQDDMAGQPVMIEMK